MTLESAPTAPTTETAAGSEPASAPSPSAQAELPLSTPASQPAKPPSWDDQLSAVWDKHNAPKQEAPPEQEPAPVEEPPKQTSDQPAKTEPEPAQSPAIAAPHSWSAEHKAEWANVPPKVQQYIAQREAQVHQWITQAGQELKAQEPIREVFEQYRQWVPPGQEAQHVRNLFAAQAMIDQNPAEGIKRLAEVYRVDISKLIAPTEPAKQDNLDDLFRDPRVDQLMKEQEQYRHALQQLHGNLSAREQAEQQSRHTYAKQVVENFASGKSDWDAVAEDVIRETAVLRQANPQIPMEQLLQDAYDRARWANPNVRQRILEDQRLSEQKAAKDAADKAAADAAKKAADAKKIQSMNVRTGASASTPIFDGKWNDDKSLSALYDRIQTGTR